MIFRPKGVITRDLFKMMFYLPKKKG